MNDETGDNSSGSRLLAALFRGLDDAVVVTDSLGNIIRASDSVKRVLGWKPSELIGQNVSALMPSPQRDEHDGYMERYLNTGKTWILGTTRQFDVVRRDGTLAPYELTVSRIDLDEYGDDRPAPCFCGVFRDVSERVETRRRLALSEAKFRAIFENENQMVLLLDATGCVVEANRPTYSRTMTSPEQVVGVVLDDLRIWSASPGNRESVARALARAYESGLATGRAAVDVADLDGSGDGSTKLVARPHEVSIRVLDDWDPELPNALVEVRNITALVEAEQRESAIIRSLARVGEEAAVLAHELRNPVTELEFALKALSKQLGEDESAVLETLAERMRRLEVLLQRTLSFSKPLDLDIRPVIVNAAFTHAISTEERTLRTRRLRSKIDVPTDCPRLRADPEALSNALSNLIRNACEAQADGGSIRLAAEVADRGVVRLIVEDEGPGIAPERRDEVFRVFFTDKPGGTGLGLALVRKIVEAHGGQVSLDSVPGGSGLRVQLDWPSLESPAPPTP